MQSLVLVVVQRDAEADLEGARATVPGARRCVVRPAGLGDAASPAGVEVLTVPDGDRGQAAVAARRHTNAEVVVVLEANERVSPELESELRALATAPAAALPGPGGGGGAGAARRGGGAGRRPQP